MPPKAVRQIVVEEAMVDLPPTSGAGLFYYPSGATYSGDWLCLPPPGADSAEADPMKIKKKPGKDDPPPPPPEPLKRVRQGKGTYTEGDYSYTGDFEKDEIQGVGRFTYASGTYYEGEWFGGGYHGHGKYMWTDGRSYDGQWQQNKMHGQGCYTDVNGHRW
eukprot:CAMPEP_0119102434 /NCGR_PEP_ID=MMETSP1180-20130426/1187_1 /TAXON_ID=3052 ORGANISM="Chlamydomonas cf sp, Strain CCMP681" /NCGR_SAMPLE_ID=MMETSP1180 /ASSEMBLY_ACC=CAM_ASM_000741 /LENGTH=160 /DNA_ID=CAMNT_0007086727 /DNA_START=66 /DNA_END=545 /DNA_ORIENTATION=+